MISGDTIVAVSSAVGPAARMIVRLSGPSAIVLASAISVAPAPDAAAASRTQLSFAGLSVPAWVYSFRNPRSYTGEDSIEFHLPGNPLLADLLLRELIAKGARLADPGEFTARAYFNGRIDLTEAEGVAATIAAGNEAELRAARRLLAGELARRIAPAMDLVAETLALVEVGIDFVEEDVSFLSPCDLRTRIARADAMLRELVEGSARFERLTHEPRVVLVGRPNAGKSTLLNALAGRERAVTSPVAGTTRDVLTAEVALPRGVVQLTDVAGLDEEEVDDVASGPMDDIERQMRRLALRAVESADLLVLVRDATDDLPPPPLPREPDLVVLSKCDLLTPDPQAFTGTPSGWHGQTCLPVSSSRTDHGQTSLPMPPIISVSALAGEHLDDLRRRLDGLAFGDPSAGSALALNARHVRAISDACGALDRAAERVADEAAELLALELRDALDALGGVLGKVTPDDLLGRIFSAFCIGK